MMNEISKYAKTLINDYAEEYQNYFEESNKNQSYFLGLRMELFGYIATLEAENEKLKAEAEKYERLEEFVKAQRKGDLQCLNDTDTE